MDKLHVYAGNVPPGAQMRVLVLGDAGSGKTTLVSALRTSAGAKTLPDPSKAGPGASLGSVEVPVGRAGNVAVVSDTPSSLGDSPGELAAAVARARPHAILLLFAADDIAAGLERVSGYWLPAIEEAFAVIRDGSAEPAGRLPTSAPVTVVCSKFDLADVQAMRDAMGSRAGSAWADAEMEGSGSAVSVDDCGDSASLSPAAVSAFRSLVTSTLLTSSAGSARFVETVLPAAFNGDSPPADDAGSASSPRSGAAVASSVLEAAILPVILPTSPLILPGADAASAAFSRAP
ncbi:hypothetical protein FNF31_00987 [Cafeteria roenbergensis]|uniref:Miro domain-containing protein n=1 Tax=Cafeteria roenbergensis TaxID=33653 RepID=A0A5A8DTH9_CAFRO|nr:hypothetical protein FNF31_00987 [Cafeteria roenbergensis]